MLLQCLATGAGLLVPVMLSRRSVTSGFQLALAQSQDEVVVNPALAEKLRQVGGIDLPALPENYSADTPEQYAAEVRPRLAGVRVAPRLRGIDTQGFPHIQVLTRLRARTGVS